MCDARPTTRLVGQLRCGLASGLGASREDATLILIGYGGRLRLPRASTAVLLQCELGGGATAQSRRSTADFAPDAWRLSIGNRFVGSAIGEVSENVVVRARTRIRLIRVIDVPRSVAEANELIAVSRVFWREKRST